VQLRERLPLEQLVTHRFPLDAAADAYRLFDERREGCIKAVFEP
jgi:threonine dehydrogenase-like Zn-dependent dehydrogenase